MLKWFPLLPSRLTLLCHFSSTSRAHSQTAEMLTNPTRLQTPSQLEGRGACFPETQLPMPLWLSRCNRASESARPLDYLHTVSLPTQAQGLLRVEGFLSSGAGKTTAALDCLENNLQFTKHSFPLSRGNAWCHPVRQAGREPTAPVCRLRQRVSGG